MSASHIAVTLAAHTNAGKTTLARTLLGRDVGEILDSEHTTRIADSYTWIETVDGNSLQLWDTPGFGDTRRLLKRLKGSEHLLGRFLSETWDRLTDSGLYYSQRALRNVRDESDCVLYLVNCAESPHLAGYLDSEMQLLQWLGKPVIVLLNQSGEALSLEDAAAEHLEWRQRIEQTYPWVDAVLPLDAFSRCWLQEFDLLHTIASALPQQHTLMASFIDHWTQQQQQRFDASIRTLGALLRDAALAAARVEDATQSGMLQRYLPTAGRVQAETAASALTQDLERSAEAAQRQLAAIHELDAHRVALLGEHLQPTLNASPRLDPRRASITGGVISGIAGGLLADIASGGLSLGGGMLAGAVLGAAAGQAASLGLNRVRGSREPQLEWNDAALESILQRIALLYLIVSHSGRGRGELVLQNEPGHWQAALAEAITGHGEAMSACWQQRDEARAALHAEGDNGAYDQFCADLNELLRSICRDLLIGLYPDSNLPAAFFDPS